MHYRTIILLIVIITQSLPVTAQSNGNGDGPEYAVKGKIVTAGKGEPLEYATAVLLKSSDSTQVDGMVTGLDGTFTLEAEKPGQYILQTSFVGYRDQSATVRISSENPTPTLGTITMSQDASQLDEVEVVASEYSMDYKIDKKVINVDEQYSSISGNAVDILQNLPSINVDIQGNVSLRGSSNFTVLIDGRPTVMQANEALQQIPATSIKNIEIITNPSAKYDPEGTGGIINIVTRKNVLMGVTGIVHLNGGLYDKYGGDFQLNYKTDGFKFFVGGDYDHEREPGSMEMENRTYTADTTFYLNTDGTNREKEYDYNASAGFEWYMSEKSTFSLSGRYGGGLDNELSNTSYLEWNSFTNGRNEYTSKQDNKRDHEFYALNSHYTYEFDSTTHKLDADLQVYTYNGGENNVNTLYTTSDAIQSSQKSEEGGPSGGLEYRLNYKQDFSKLINIEVGAQGSFRNSDEWNDMYHYNNTSQSYELQEKFSHESTYRRSIHAGYALVKGEFKNLDYQVGLRGEHTYRNIKSSGHDDPFRIDRWDIFPTFHASYRMQGENQLMISYTRRIDRPRSWFMEPFLTWEDAYSVRRGNPGLQPEYINSYELGYQKDFDGQTLSLEMYYRRTKNRVEFIQSVYEENVMLQTFENVGYDYNLGTELMFNFNVDNWWENSLTANFYRYRVEGELNQREFDRKSFSWSLNWNQTFHIAENTQIQINPEYEGPEVEAQEREKGYFEVDGALRQSLMDEKLSLTLQVRDIFSTAKYESIIDEPEFYNYRRFEHKTPIMMLNLTWNINNDDQGDRDGGRRGGGGMGF